MKLCLPEQVRIGGLSKRELLHSLSKHAIRWNQAAEDLFQDDRFQASTREMEVPIRATSLEELGFPEGATYPRIIARAHEWGLRECPLELGPFLRMQYQEATQRVGAQNSGAEQLSQGKAPIGSLTVASRPLDEKDQTPKGFYLRSLDGERWLRGYWADFEHVWSCDDLFVFAC